MDDLRGADVLIHVVDVSGTTDQNGKVTTGYDPINDIDWLHSEIHKYIFFFIFNNIDNIIIIKLKYESLNLIYINFIII